MQELRPVVFSVGCYIQKVKGLSYSNYPPVNESNLDPAMSPELEDPFPEIDDLQVYLTKGFALQKKMAPYHVKREAA